VHSDECPLQCSGRSPAIVFPYYYLFSQGLARITPGESVPVPVPFMFLLLFLFLVLLVLVGACFGHDYFLLCCSLGLLFL